MGFKNVADNINPYLYQDLKIISHTLINWEEFRDKKLLITGATGFIGSYLILALLMLNDLYNLNICIYGLVRNIEKAKKKFNVFLERSDFRLLIQDICEPIALENKVDFIIHAASPASNIQFETSPVETINTILLGTNNLLEWAHRNNTQSILFISSLKVYGTFPQNDFFLTEDMVGDLNFKDYKNCYAEGKRAAETICSSYIKEYSLPIKIARPGYVYGASSLTDDRVWAQFIANAVNNKNIILKSAGTIYRSFCYIADVTTALFYILLNGCVGEVYNISDPNSNVMIRDFAEIVTKCFPEKKLQRIFCNLDDEKTTSTFSDIPWEILDNTKLLQLGWTPQIDLYLGIQRSVKILEYDLKKA